MGFLNGWTKDQVKKTIDTLYTGRAFEGTHAFERCLYKTEDGRKCAVGIFIPDGHMAQNLKGSVPVLLAAHPDLTDMLPLSGRKMQALQKLHDDKMLSDFFTKSVEEQKNMLYSKMISLSEETWEGE